MESKGPYGQQDSGIPDVYLLQQALGRNLPIVTLLQYPTVRALASQLAGNGDSRLAAQAVNDRARRQQEAMARVKAARKG